MADDKSKRLIIFGVIAALALAGIAYWLGARNNPGQVAQDKTNIQNQLNNQSNNPAVPGNPGGGTNLPEDTAVEAKLRSESIVQYGYVYALPTLVFMPVIAKDGTTAASAKTLADKYAAELKAKYSGREISVQVVDKTGKSLASINTK